MSVYKDINDLFTPDPKTGDLAVVEDAAAVAQAVKNLVLTSHFERPFQPSIGSGVYDLLFEPMNTVTEYVLAKTIKDVIDKFEPRATVDYIDVYSSVGPNGEPLSQHEIFVVVAFYVRNNPQLMTTTILLKRTR